jgi:hypothetical protein
VPEEFPRRELYARVSRVDTLSNSPYRRASFEFDCVDADHVDDAGMALTTDVDEIRPFALLRVVTTPARFKAFAGDLPVPGDWYHLAVEPSGLGLPTWHSQLSANGYSNHARGLTTYARRINSPDDVPRRPGADPQTLGAAVAPRVVLPSSLVAACAALPRLAAHGAISAILKNVSRATSVLVRDVGQANFSSLRDDQGRAILHYDVGFPISFNRHTFPNPHAFNIDSGETPPIVLSHWDWDHLHGALCLPPAELLMDCPRSASRTRRGAASSNTSGKRQSVCATEIFPTSLWIRRVNTKSGFAR